MTLIDLGDDSAAAWDSGQSPALTQRQRWLLPAIIAGLAMLAAPPVLVHAGAFGPRIHAAEWGWRGAFIDNDGHTTMATDGAPPTPTVSSTVTIVNDGWSTVRVLDASVVATGMAFDHATVGDAHLDGDVVRPGGRRLTRQDPVGLKPGEMLEITLFLTITDCRSVGQVNQRVTIQISSWRGGQTASVPVPMVRRDNGGWTVTNSHDPNGISSLRYLADLLCQSGG